MNNHRDYRQTVPPLHIRETPTADLLIMLENRERYMAQSAATNTGRPAALPARAAISRGLHPPKLNATEA